MDQIEKMMKDKLPAIEALFASKESPIKVSHPNPGYVLFEDKNGPMVIAPEHVEALQVYMNLLLLFKPEELRGATQTGTEAAGPN